MAEVKSVIIYSTPHCGFCKMLKAYLDEKGVAHEVIDVMADMDQAKAMVELSGQSGVPVMVVNKGEDDQQFVVGFDKARVDELLGL